MVKRILLGVGVAFGRGLLFFGRDVLSYARTSVGAVKDTVRSSVPIEFELERARQMIRDLEPEVRKNMHAIAKDEVEVKQLGEKIAQLDSRLVREKEDILRLKKDLENAKGKDVFEYGGRKYTTAQVHQDLANRFERYKTGEATLAQWRKLHQTREQSVEANRQRLEGMLAARRQLEVQVESLEAHRQMLAAAQTTSNSTFDDSKLGRAKELVSELQTRLAVAEKLLAAEGTFHGEIPVSEPTPTNLLDEVGQYFEPAQAEAQSLAKAK
jgi:chromosome segregation ATPase